MRCSRSLNPFSFTSSKKTRAFVKWLPVVGHEHEPALWALRALTLRFSIAREVLLTAERFDDEASLTALINSLPAEFVFDG